MPPDDANLHPADRGLPEKSKGLFPCKALPQQKSLFRIHFSCQCNKTLLICDSPALEGEGGAGGSARSSNPFLIDQTSPLQRRKIAQVDRLRQILLLVIGPELADIGVGLD